MQTAGRLIVLCLAVLLAACQNPYVEFYTDHEATGILPYAGEPAIKGGSGNPDQDIALMFEEGYGLIGSASFTGPQQDKQQAILQAKKVGAAIIIVNEQYLKTKSGAIPITTPTSSTAYTSGNINTYNSYGGYGYGSYSGTTTVYGSTTTYIPYSVDHFEHSALFFAPLERRGLGVLLFKASNQQRQAAGTNKGVLVGAVRRGSPAYDADILPGDILITISNHPVNDQPSAAYAIFVSLGSPAEIVLNRTGREIHKWVMIPSFGW